MNTTPVAFALLLLAATPEGDYSHYVPQWRTRWEYTGPRGVEHWSSLDPAYALCGSGQAQSPVDIGATVRSRLPALQFAYVREPLKYVINNGYTIRVNYHDAPGSGSYLTVGGKRYQLTQFHFHRPSEELLHGRRYDMVLHLMHKADDGEVAGVAVMLVVGHANPLLTELWKHMPASEGQLAVPGLELDPAAMLPQDTGYYTYRGSQTAPPCTEGVRWFVLKNPVEISAEQDAAFARLYPRDVRPVQPLNGRVVEESE